MIIAVSCFLRPWILCFSLMSRKTNY